MFAALETFILSTMNSLYNTMGWLGVALLLVFENATGITPSEIILGFAGWMLVANNQVSPYVIFVGALFSALGSVVGASIPYWIARKGGRPLVNKLAHWLRIKDVTILKIENQFKRWGKGIVLVGRMVPGVRTVINIPAGLADMTYIPFVATTFIGAYIWCGLLIGAGYLLGNEWSMISTYLNQYFPYILVGGVVLILMYMLLIKRKRTPAVQQSEHD